MTPDRIVEGSLVRLIVGEVDFGPTIIIFGERLWVVEDSAHLLPVLVGGLVVNFFVEEIREIFFLFGFGVSFSVDPWRIGVEVVRFGFRSVYVLFWKVLLKVHVHNTWLNGIFAGFYLCARTGVNWQLIIILLPELIRCRSLLVGELVWFVVALTYDALPHTYRTVRLPPFDLFVFVGLGDSHISEVEGGGSWGVGALFGGEEGLVG